MNRPDFGDAIMAGLGALVGIGAVVAFVVSVIDDPAAWLSFTSVVAVAILIPYTIGRFVLWLRDDWWFNRQARTSTHSKEQ